MTIVLRDAVPDDADAIARVHVAAWRAAYRGIVPDEHLAALDPEEGARRRRRTLEQRVARRAAFVAEQDGTLAGWLQVGPTRDEDDDPRRVAEVYALYLEPASWGRRIGTALMDRALAHARRERFRGATVWVLEANGRARGFYASCGFTCDDARKLVSIGGTDLVEVRYRRAVGTTRPASEGR